MPIESMMSSDKYIPDVRRAFIDAGVIFPKNLAPCHLSKNDFPKIQIKCVGMAWKLTKY